MQKECPPLGALLFPAGQPDEAGRHKKRWKSPSGHAAYKTSFPCENRLAEKRGHCRLCSRPAPALPGGTAGRRPAAALRAPLLTAAAAPACLLAPARSRRHGRPRGLARGDREPAPLWLQAGGAFFVANCSANYCIPWPLMPGERLRPRLCGWKRAEKACFSAKRPHASSPDGCRKEISRLVRPDDYLGRHGAPSDSEAEKGAAPSGGSGLSRASTHRPSSLTPLSLTGCQVRSSFFSRVPNCCVN